MEGKKFNTPEILKIKGYKYRAKMLIVGAVLLFVVILLLSLIFRGIASTVRSLSTSGKEETDTEAAASVVSAPVQAPPEIVSSAPPIQSQPVVSEPVESTAPPMAKEERFDADNKLIIDTDTLDGKKAVAITFDDGPSEYTEQLISGLDKRGVKATFFMVGKNIPLYPKAVNMMIQGGHQLGCHTYDHMDIASASMSTVNDSIARTDSELLNICGQKSTAFRPPYGSYTPSEATAIDKTFMLWSLDTLDWKTKDAEKVRAQISDQARDGSVILLHDLYKTSVDGALAGIDELSARGFVFVTVDQLMTRYGYQINPGAHSAQYAVYETNSPHADEYREDERRDREKDEAAAAAANQAANQAASQAANNFYYDSKNNSDREEKDEDTFTQFEESSDRENDN